MEGWFWFSIGVGPIVLIFTTSVVFLNRFRKQRQILSKRIDQIGVRLEEQLSSQLVPSVEFATRSASQEVLQDVPDLQSYHNNLNSLSLSSIAPAREPDAILSNRLKNVDVQLNDESDLAMLNLASHAVLYVRTHISETIRVDQMAHQLHASKSKLNRFLKKSLGCSAQELITVMKMQEAKRLLKMSDLLIKEIADRVGFEHPLYFSARFKLFFGISPTDFRQHYEQLEDQSHEIPMEIHPLPIESAHLAQQSHQDSPEPRVKRKKRREPFALPAGTAIDRFIIVSQIGQGGMGIVYKAYDPKLNRGVALKLIRGDHAKRIQSQDRLLREAQALARLSHPNVLHVYDVGTSDNQLFIAMALVEGMTLNRWLRGQKRSIKEIVKVMTAAGRGLSAAHKAGLIHRDFKPSNVIVGDDGQVRVLDFGLARAVVGEEKEQVGSVDDPHWDLRELSSGSNSDLLLSPLTYAGSVLGTPQYMAPEQHIGEQADERTDQFGFCVVLYEALYGMRPFAAKTIGELKNEVVRQRIRVPPADSEVPDWLWRVVRKGLSAKPDSRYPSISSLLRDLDKDPEEVHQKKRVARKRTLLVISLLLLTIALPVGIWYGLQYRTVQLCKATVGEFEGIWDDKTKESIHQAFLGINKSFAQSTWQRVEQNIGDYLDEWVNLRSEVCEARHIRGTQSEELFDLRMSCLRRRLRELKALTSVLAKADSGVVEKSIQASSSLAGVNICADEDALRAPYPPPKTEENRLLLAAFNKKLAKVNALTKTGKYRMGLELVRKLEKEVEGLNYRPLQAQVLYQLGELLERTGDYTQAENILDDAARMAGASGDSVLLARTMAFLGLVVGCRQMRHAEGLLFGRYAEFVLGIGGGDDRARAEILGYLGVVYREQGKFDKALDYFQQVLTIRKKTLGPEHPYVAWAVSSMGLVFLDKDEFDKALACFHQGLRIQEKTLGPEHPYVSYSLNNIGYTLQEQSKFEEALEYYRQALAIWEKTLGSEHPLLAWPLNGIGNAFVSQDKPQLALEALERTGVICKKKTCNPEPHGRGLFCLARALVRTGGDKRRAIDLAKQARAIFKKTPKAFKKELDDVDTWMRANGHEKQANRQRFDQPR